MRVAQFEDEKGPCIGIGMKGGWINYTKARPAFALLEHGTVETTPGTIAELLANGGFNPEEFRKVLAFVRENGLRRKLIVGTHAVLKAPILRPPKIIALGLNYVLHAKEGNFQVPKEPIIFMKAGSSVVGPGDVVRLPRGFGRMDHEVELAVVIGTYASGVKRRVAHKCIAGYCICNDVTARDLQTKDLEKRHPWFRSKSFDTFSPLGPWIVTADEIRPPVRLNLECRVNGKIRQRANTRDLVFGIPTVIEFITKYIALEPGDIVSTGTPEGIGPIEGGDTMVCRIERIGELKNPVRFR
jgi:2-keto-4-pentenoate hydratase/2-oxohepta-3-ene-1,7-dioic acid hydratase in catechol pathway